MFFNLSLFLRDIIINPNFVDDTENFFSLNFLYNNYWIIIFFFIISYIFFRCLFLFIYFYTNNEYALKQSNSLLNLIYIISFILFILFVIIYI